MPNSLVFRSAIIAGLAGLCVNAMAQTPEDDALEEIVVTGYHLKRTDREGPVPVQIFDREFLERRGIDSLDDFVRALNYNALTTSEQSASFRPERGASQINLRGIGAQHTLVLVNGFRMPEHARSVAFGGYTDLNAIPLQFVERIEIVTDGASAIYGADAVGGVVNIITRRDLVMANAGVMTTTEGDGTEIDIGLSGSTTLAGFELSGTASYFSRDHVKARDRDWSADSDRTAYGGYGRGTPFSGPPSALVFGPTGPMFAADPACADASQDIVSVEPIFGPFGLNELCFINTPWWEHSIPESTRYGVQGSARRPVTANAEFFAELFYSTSEVITEFAPPPTVFNLPTLTGWPFVAPDHPSNPFGAPLELLGRIIDAGPRGDVLDNDVSRAIAGMEGIAGRWDWSVSALYSESTTRTSPRVIIDQEAYQAALLGFGGPNGDQYYNPFGVNPVNSSEIIDEFAIRDVRFGTTNTEWELGAQVATEIGSLPAGPMGLALGAQYRDQSLDESDGFSIGRDVTAFYAELAVPLAEDIEAQIAVRHESYNDFGSATSPKVAARWQALDNLVLRGSWGSSFSPPTFLSLTLDDPPDGGPRGVSFLRDLPRCASLNVAPEDCPFEIIRWRNDGNPNLDPEEGDSWNLGIVWTTDWLAGFEFALDYWRFDHEDRVIFIGARYILENLPADNPFVRRGPADPGSPPGALGPIELVSETFINAARLETSGVDLDVRLGWDAPVGRIDFAMQHTYVTEFRVSDAFAGETGENQVGEATVQGPLPEWRSTYSATWMRDRHTLNLTATYVDGYRSGLNVVQDNLFETDEPYFVDSWTSVDLQYRYRVDRFDDAELVIGCRNCLDEAPPDYNDRWQAEGFHDGRGAMIYARWIQSFGR